MENNLKEIQEIARRKVAELDLQTAKPRFKKILGRLVKLKLLQTTMEHIPNTIKMDVKDYLWAGQYESRILELIPALILKKPGMFKKFNLVDLPEDLRQVVKDIKAGVQPQSFRKVPAKKFVRWIEHVGHKGKKPVSQKNVRINTQDQEVLNALKRAGYTESSAFKKGIRVLLDSVQQS